MLSKNFILLLWMALVIGKPLLAQEPESLLLIHVNIVDVENGRVLKNRNVIIKNDRITAIYPGTKYNKVKSQEVVDGKRTYLIPGLIDTHLHLHYELQAGQWETLRLVLKFMLANGITGIREASGSGLTRQLASVRDSINSGALLGPKMYVSGIASPQNLKRFNAESYAALVDSFSRIGIDGIKIKYNSYSETKEIIAGAQKHVLPVYGHTYNALHSDTENVLGDFTAGAVASGISGVMHTSGYVPLKGSVLPSSPEPRFTDTSKLWDKWWLYHDALWLYADPVLESNLIKAMVAKGVWLEPTLSVESIASTYNERLRSKALDYYFYNDSLLVDGLPLPTGSALDTARLVFQRKQQFVKRFYDAGGTLAAGTDGQLYGADLRDELRFMVQAGLPPAAALKVVTYNNAKILGWLNDLGTVHTGKIANLVLLSKNPLNDINNLETVKGIFLNGRYYDKSILNQWLKEIKEVARKHKNRKS